MKKTVQASLAVTAMIVAVQTASATIVDLTTSSTGTVQTTYGTAIFTTDFTQPAGSGVIDPFLTIQANGTEEGYNTSAKSGVFDTKREPTYNHEIRVSDLSSVNIGGANYYSFLLDINEPNSSATSEISFDMLKIYTSSIVGQTTTNVDSLGVKRFDLDMPSDSYIKYNDLNSGSGQADIAFFIPVSAFAGSSSSDYVYMYQKFGMNISADFTGTTQGGYEETAIGAGVSPVPEAATVLPLAAVLGMVVGGQRMRVRRKAQA